MNISRAPEIFDRMTALADTTRSRMLLVLERHELTVNELKSVLQLPQSTVSRHLKILGDEGWVVSRPEGTSRRYRTGMLSKTGGWKRNHLRRATICSPVA